MSLDAMKQALEALELLARYENPETKIQVRKPRDGGSIMTMYPHKVASEAATALRAAIEQAQEPVAWMTFNAVGDEDDIWYVNPDGKLLEGWTYKPLYTAPRQWQGLTDEELWELWNSHTEQPFPDWFVDFKRAYEVIAEKLKEKNT